MEPPALPGRFTLEIDYMQWPRGVGRATQSIYRAWLRRSRRDPAARPELLLLEDGRVDVEAATRLNKQRDRRTILLAE